MTTVAHQVISLRGPNLNGLSHGDHLMNLPSAGLAWTHVAISNKSSVKAHNEYHSLSSGVICELQGIWVHVCPFSFKYSGEMQSKIHIQILEKLKKSEWTKCLFSFYQMKVKCIP